MSEAAGKRRKQRAGLPITRSNRGSVMADSQHTGQPAGVTQAKRSSYLRHVQIHMELLQDALTGQDFGCGAGQGDREKIERHLLEIWEIAYDAKLEAVAPRPARIQSGKVIPFRRTT
jgi:hypothetical protein